jgi:hypothetical protein
MFSKNCVQNPVNSNLNFRFYTKRIDQIRNTVSSKVCAWKHISEFCVERSLHFIVILLIIGNVLNSVYYFV